ncbi:hypothetical protein TNIN_372781 [Trichonephila inaurata madagascariensis]|uniref:Uncharacterized protein n=1 Tax=Trichonephila inaurata madagascariensis TaxID=2747483 RepID=A0A8X7BRT3_9ARAC|nr:hypothetical protein TNIN_372781 [Trichonephila inaurata madagascariensis]
MFALQHLSSHFGALTCTIRLRRGRGCVWTFRHTHSTFTEQRKSVNPVRERPLKLIAEVAYIKAALFRAVRDDQRLASCASISQNNVFQPDHGHQEMLTGFRATVRPSDPSLTPNFAGERQVVCYRFSPPSARQMSAFFQHLSSHFLGA